jgi:predicted dehydrogenase
VDDEPVSVGLVGAGPWASLVHAPVLAAGPETRLVGVWARRPEASAQLAARHGAQACSRIEELFDRCEAVAFAVPPEVQADLAADAARAGKAVLLEKPIAADVAGAERLADVIGGAGMASVVVLSWRYAVPVRAFLATGCVVRRGGRARHVRLGRVAGRPVRDALATGARCAARPRPACRTRWTSSGACICSGSSPTPSPNSRARERSGSLTALRVLVRP